MLYHFRGRVGFLNPRRPHSEACRAPSPELAPDSALVCHPRAYFPGVRFWCPFDLQHPATKHPTADTAPQLHWTLVQLVTACPDSVMELGCLQTLKRRLAGKVVLHAHIYAHTNTHRNKHLPESSPCLLLQPLCFQALLLGKQLLPFTLYLHLGLLPAYASKHNMVKATVLQVLAFKRFL